MSDSDYAPDKEKDKNRHENKSKIRKHLKLGQSMVMSK